jgi:hypothetical protein
MAAIMQTTEKTARHYCTGKARPDPARIQLLEAVAGKKLIPQDAPLWWDDKTGEIRTESDLGYTAEAINQGRMFATFYHETDRHAQALADQVAALERENAALRGRLARLEREQTPAPVPDNVIPFPRQQHKEI